MCILDVEYLFNILLLNILVVDFLFNLLLMYILGVEFLIMCYSFIVGLYRIYRIYVVKFLSVNLFFIIYRLREKELYFLYKEVSLKLGLGYCM